MQVALGYGANDPHVSGERSGLPSPWHYAWHHRLYKPLTLLWCHV
jgi:hypothetical protein